MGICGAHTVARELCREVEDDCGGKRTSVYLSQTGALYLALLLCAMRLLQAEMLSRFDSMYSLLYTRFILDLYARLLSGWWMQDDYLDINQTQIGGA